MAASADDGNISRSPACRPDGARRRLPGGCHFGGGTIGAEHDDPGKLDKARLAWEGGQAFQTAHLRHVQIEQNPIRARVGWVEQKIQGGAAVGYMVYFDGHVAGAKTEVDPMGVPHDPWPARSRNGRQGRAGAASWGSRGSGPWALLVSCQPRGQRVGFGWRAAWRQAGQRRLKQKLLLPWPSPGDSARILPLYCSTILRLTAGPMPVVPS